MRKQKIRPLLRYYGGKFRLSPWIINHFPNHKIYTEAFGGAGSVLLKKPKSYGEVYNDIDGEMVNLFRVVRDQGRKLKRAVELTPFSREEFINAYEQCDCPIERARRTIIKSQMGFGANAIFKPSGFRGNAKRSYTIPAHDWKGYAKALTKIIVRMKGVIIENLPAGALIQKYDSEEALHYVDPPYLPETRTRGHRYRHEMTRQDHEQLAEILKNTKGKVIISGYESDLYDSLYSGWGKVKKHAVADGGLARTEILWIKPS